MGVALKVRNSACVAAALLAGCGGTTPGATQLIPASPLSPARSSYSVLYSFQGGSDGVAPYGTVSFDAGGALYGTTSEGGIYSCRFVTRVFGCGTIFKLAPSGSAYAEHVLYRFCSHSCGGSGATPDAGLILGRNGQLYGTASFGGNDACTTPDTIGCGTAFRIGPSGEHYHVLYHFDGTDGADPNSGLTFGKDGALYGTTDLGGTHRYGTVYKLTLSGSSYVERVLYNFKGTNNGPDGAFPVGGVILAKGGLLYGTTAYGGAHGWGGVYALTPAGAGYKERVIYSFCSFLHKRCKDGSLPQAGLAIGKNGALYGTAAVGGAHQGGNVFRLTPSGSTYAWSALYSFCSLPKCHDGSGPYGRITFGENGVLYGTTLQGGAFSKGTIFELTPSKSGYSASVLHSFDGSDGQMAFAGLIFGKDGALYGTTAAGGAHGYGTVFRLTLRQAPHGRASYNASRISGR